MKKKRKMPRFGSKAYIAWINKKNKSYINKNVKFKKTHVPPSSQSSSSSNNSQSGNILEKFSAGELDLATSFWGFLFVVTLIIGFVCGWLSAAYGKGWVIPLVLYTLFAIQGTWKSAEKYKIQQSKRKQTLLWGFLAQVACVLNVISIIATLAENY